MKEGKGLKMLTRNKLLTRFPISLAQIKSGNNLYKLKTEIRQILYLLYHLNKITKRLQQFYQVIIIMQENLNLIRCPKMFRFHLDQPKDVDDTLKHETEFIIKINESLAENQIKDKIDQLLLKHKHGNNFREHKKQSQKFGTQETATNKPQKFVFSFSQQRLDLRSSKKHVALQSLPSYYK